MLQPIKRTTNSTSADAPAQSPPASQSSSDAAPSRKRGDRQLGERVRSLSLKRLPERRSNAVRNTAWIIGSLAALVIGWWGYTHYYAPRSGEEPAMASVQKPAQPEGAAKRERPLAQGGDRPPTSAVPSPQTPPVPPAPAVSRPPVRLPAKGEVALEAKGYIVPAHQILVSPKVSGMIVKLDIEEGRRVNKGDVLAVLESTDYAADQQRAAATVRLMRERLRELENGNRPEEIQEAQADLLEAESLVPQLEAEYKRTAGLRVKNSATQQEYELAESKYLAQVQRGQRLRFALKLMQIGPRPERIESARAELAQAEADLAKAEWRLGNCTIRAPITGTILKKNAEEGNIVNPIAFNGSYSLCDMADLSDLEVDLNIQERDISVVEVGQQCRIRAEAYPNRIYEGHVDRLMPIADRAKGAIPVRVKIRIPAEEEGVFLKPEMGAIVTFLNQQAAQTTAVAAEAGQALSPARNMP